LSATVQRFVRGECFQTILRNMGGSTKTVKFNGKSGFKDLKENALKNHAVSRRTLVNPGDAAGDDSAPCATYDALEACNEAGDAAVGGDDAAPTTSDAPETSSEAGEAA